LVVIGRLVLSELEALPTSGVIVLRQNDRRSTVTLATAPS